ncbi:17070_t:CDS:1, partial [Dentiscutata heterogama]
QIYLFTENIEKQTFIMNNLTNQATGAQPSISQNTTAHIDLPINAIAAHLINGANPFAEIQRTETQTVPLQNVQLSDVLFSGSSFVQHK